MNDTGTGMMTGVQRRGYGAAVAWLALTILLAGSSVCTAAILNPSFETYYMGLPYPRQLPQSWYHSDHPSFNSKCTNLWSTDGSLSAGLCNLVGKPISAGNSESFYQILDLTGMGAITFDVRLAAYPTGAFEHFQAQFLVDNVPVWSRTQGGEHLNQQVKIGKMSGWHRIEMRITALDSGQFDLAYWSQWDNLRLVEGPAAIEAKIDFDPDTLNLASNGQWITAYIELGDGYDPNSIDGPTVKLEEIGEQGWAISPGNGVNTLDYDGDGVVERMVKFDRSAVQAVVAPPQATLTVTGMLNDGTPFAGAGVIRVVGGKAAKGK
jgi:hypothetical protein